MQFLLMVERLYRLICAINFVNRRDGSAVTETKLLRQWMPVERLFDARVGAASASGVITITDQEDADLRNPRSGDGALFGTDEANGGGLLARETMRNNISLHGRVII